MEFPTSKVVFCSAVFGLALTATFTACGDENATEVVDSSGMAVVAKGDSLPECGADNVGSMVFVPDSSAVFYCADEKWSSLNGMDGEKGESGKNGDEGSSCIAMAVGDDIEVICGDEVVGTIKSGKDGEKGEKGNPGEVGQSGVTGTSCTAKVVNEGIEVSCGGEVVGTIKNGVAGETTDGKNGKSCFATQDEKTKNVVITCEIDDGKGVSYTIQNGTDGKDAYEIAKDNGFEGSVTDWLASLNGKDGKSCSATQNADKTVTTITCQDDEGKAVTYDVKNGEGCSAEDNEDGSYTIHCEGSDDVIINDGESAYELSGSNLSLEKWIESLKGKQGDNCTFEGYKSKDQETIGVKITCGSEEKIVLNGNDGNPGVGCSFEDMGDGVVYMTCGKSNPVTLFKAVCGAESYDPEEKYCIDGVLYEMCGGKLYDSKKSVCLESSIYFVTKGTMTDSRGEEQTYNTVTIGRSYKSEDNETEVQYSETWMAENLNYEVDGGSQSWCYGNDNSKCDSYGRLYTWYAAMSACPEGWHLPNKDEWKNFLTVIGGYETAGKRLKVTTWGKGEDAGSDDFGFSVLPAGKYNRDEMSIEESIFEDLGEASYFWSATEFKFDSEPVYRQATTLEVWINLPDIDDLDETHRYKEEALSVRCIKNKESSTSN